MTQPIRILRVIGRYAPAWQYGGSVRYSHDLDAALARQGFSLTVYTSDQIDGSRRAPLRRETLGAVDVHRFPTPWNYAADRAQWLAMYPLGLRQALHERVTEFDLLHVTEGRAAHVRWAFDAARRAGVPIVWSPLGALADGVGLRRPYRRLYDRLHRTRRLMSEARIVIAQSPHEASVVERLGAWPSRIRIIGLGVDERAFQTLPPRGALRDGLGIGRSQPMILFLGRFHPAKGLDVLLRSVAIARRRYPDLQLVLIGWDDGALRTVERVARALDLGNALRILPPAFDRARLQAYVDADAFAASLTIYEETSLAAMEALACGTPCVLSRQCEIPGLEATGGGRVANCDPEAFAAALVAVLSDPARVAHAAAARRWILAAHAIDRVASAHAVAFREAVGAAGDWPAGVAAGRASSW
ncbi:MAG: hypothetical protein A3I61_01435 [Acidobacteria bacterium RIFCSPLOWO2_02_FULL_68_18]|nr:MAG: hypothetical protein A3I61_01435 [Acidobacteria bacterium RIFCSPLOWO2_02_FULL_68_18]OFW51576.1 MAG: hypothetical protein A3G77_18830 [Acidobacteria bacterium RIFCSPLOWO2_12_FULL_68_19]